MKFLFSKNSYFLLFLLFAFSGISQTLTPEEVAYKKKFDEMLESEVADTLKLKFCNKNLSTLDYQSSNLPIQYTHKTLALAESLDDLKMVGRMKSILGLLYCSTGVYDSSIVYLDAALVDYEAISLNSGKTYVHGLLSYVYTRIKDFDTALEHSFKILKISQEDGDTKAEGIAYSNIAEILLFAENNEEALKYAIKGRDILQRHDDYNQLAIVLLHISHIHRNLGNYEKAILFINNAIQLRTENLDTTSVYFHNELDNLSILLENKANFLTEIKRFDEALASIALMQKYYEGKNENSRYLDIQYQKAGIFFQQEKFELAKNIYLEILNHEDADFIMQTQWRIQQELSSIYAELGQFDSAYFYQKEHEKVSLEEKGHESKLKMEELKTEYETEQKEATIALQEKQINQQKMIQWLALGFAGVLGLLFFQFYRNAQTRKRNNEALEKTNGLLEKKNKENEVLLKEIHHRVKNNLQTISSLLNLQSNSITDQNALDAVQESRNRVASMALIHQKLYQGENLAAIEMRDYFETIGNAILDSFGEKAKQVELEIEMPEIELDVDTAIPIGLITNELITNSLKYAFLKKEGGKISIAMKRAENNIIQLKIADNGTHNELAGERQNGTGFGTMLVQLLTTQLGGEIKKSTEGGTSTVIQFALKKELAA